MLTNKNIVVTGANRGIGKAITEECVRNNANVWACMRTVSPETKDWIEKLEKEKDVFIKPVIIDFEDEESIKSAGSSIIGEKLTIDGIVNNAGVIGNKSLFSMTEMSDIKKTFQVNFFGPMYFTQRFIKKFIRQKYGSIVNISSIASIDGDPGQFGYVSSKAAINGATKKLANELGQFGVRVNAVAPGMTDTEMVSNMENSLMEDTLKRTALGRLAKPCEIAKLCVFLLSEQSDFVTGQVIRIDGGSI
ncbi:MAG: SDR family oxidoreductase [Lachnospiraceae bacterium]|nr:SDR family oxidoreductase [Lachnospiraceae bacterium]